MNAIALKHRVMMSAVSAPVAPSRSTAHVGIPRNPVAAPRVSLMGRHRSTSPLSLSWIGLAR